jgi:hypothetical protein
VAGIWASHELERVGDAEAEILGHLVTELVYTYLDADVCRWLEDNKAQPQHGRNWHQWMTEQYGLRKVIQHIYMLIGVAKTCHNMRELRDKMAEMYGKSPAQLTLFLPSTKTLTFPQ